MTHRTITLQLTDLQIELLRRWINEAPTNPYVPMVASILPQLPMDTDPEACDRYLNHRLQKSAADSQPSADSRRPVPLLPVETGRGFQLRALTPRAVPIVETIDNVLRTLLPHGGDL